MKTHKYKNYDEYKKCQISANAKKSSNVWAKEENIKFLAEYIKKHNNIPAGYNDRVIDGICHGVRSGLEQAWFRMCLVGDVFGTEIGDASAPNTVKWDFNKINKRWIGCFDFVYSNSFDHAFDPEMTLAIWSNQCKPGGLIILEYDRRQEHTGEISMSVNKTDPVSITLDELIKLVPKWSDNMKVVDVLDMPVVTQEWRKSLIIEVG